jgi:hypothetical protein
VSYLLRPPVVKEPQPNAGRLFGRVPIPRGVSLLVVGTTVTEARYVTIEDIESVDAYYAGGHEYTLSDDEAQILIDAGYGDNLEPL